MPIFALDDDLDVLFMAAFAACQVQTEGKGDTVNGWELRYEQLIYPRTKNMDLTSVKMYVIAENCEVHLWHGRTVLPLSPTV